MTRGRFITLEGGEGTGKSTQVKRLAAWLAPQVGEVVTTREPGGSPGAEAIRKLVVTGDPDRWSGQTETLLMYAARSDHIERTIKPALLRGAWVVCDRYHDSTRVYQGQAGGAGKELMDALETQILADIVPDLTLILDLPVRDGLARAAARSDGEDRFESKSVAFHEALRAFFQSIADSEPKRCVVIDARGNIDEVAARIQASVAERLLA